MEKQEMILTDADTGKRMVFPAPPETYEWEEPVKDEDEWVVYGEKTASRVWLRFDTLIEAEIFLRDPSAIRCKLYP